MTYTFRRLKAENNKILYSIENRYACFNTGLLTPTYEYIYAFFEANNKQSKSSQPFFFVGFFKGIDSRITSHFSILPEIANYFSDPSLLIYNPNLPIAPNIEHIIADNTQRFPEALRNNPDLCRITMSGAILDTQKRIRANYKLAVPHWHCYMNKIQLLVPLYLLTPSGNPDLALAIEKVENQYIARTCLTMAMAYQNARLIVKPESTWLLP
ncbi:MAG: DUF3825 domain-containing protein [Victivallales bacterium]|nr:DUF3825 domain-containing protein [Victivallales bacterium]